MASQYETEKTLFRVMMDLQSYLLAIAEHDYTGMKMWEHNLRQHVLYYRDHVQAHHNAPEWETISEDADNG